MSGELTYLYGWARAKLLADVGIAAAIGTKVYPADQTPQAVATPYITLDSKGDGLDVGTVNSTRIFAELLMSVDLWDKPEYASSMLTVMNLVDAALHKSSGTMNGAQIYGCVRVGQYRERDNEDTKFLKMGYIFRAVVQRV